MRRQITNRDCLRYQFRRCARILGEDPQARSDHALGQAVRAADIRRQQGSLRRDALIDAKDSIPTRDYRGAYIRDLQDAVAGVMTYMYLIEHPGDIDGMVAVADRIRSRRVGLVDEMRVYARDILDMAARLAGLPEWRRTCHYQGCL